MLSICISNGLRANHLKVLVCLHQSHLSCNVVQTRRRRYSKHFKRSLTMTCWVSVCFPQQGETVAKPIPADAFLPFQIEDASSSAFVLYLIRAIAPSLIQRDTWCDHLNCVLDKLIAKGNPAAPLRRKELRQLEQILAPLTPRSTSSSLQPVNLHRDAQESEDTYGLDPVDVGDGFEWDLLGLNSSVSLPPRELLDLADQLDVESIMHSVGSYVG